MSFRRITCLAAGFVAIDDDRLIWIEHPIVLRDGFLQVAYVDSYFFG